MEKKADWMVLGGALLVLFFASLYVIRPMLDAVILAAFFAYITHPLTERLERIVKVRSLAAIIVVVLAILPVVLISIQLMSIYTREFARLDSLAISMPFQEEVDWQTLYVSSLDLVKERMGPEKVLAGVGYGFELVLKTFIVIAGSFYMLRERIALKEFLISLAPPSKRPMGSYYLESIDQMFYGVFIGHFITSAAVGFIAGLGFYLIGRYLGIPLLAAYPFLMGSITGIATLLPIVGAWLVWVPLSLGLFLFGNQEAALATALLGVLFLTLLPDIVIRPYISGKKGKTHPFVVLLGFVCGPLVFGAMGLIIGPAILGLFKATLDTYKNKIWRSELENYFGGQR
jgi:predicted PurR-regulated permease PerM